MRPRLWTLVLLTCSWPIANDQAATPEMDRCDQSIVVLTDSWTSTSAVMHSFGRERPSRVWKDEGVGIPVVLGKNGLGRGRGLLRLDLARGPDKKEGDDRAPAGIFRLSSAFGYASAHSAAWVKLPYLALSKDVAGIDDPNSRYYNKLVDRSKVAKIDWRSSEQMRRDDVLYKWGVVVDHNPAALPGAGSCIFLHIWKSSSTPTTGCTAMPESELVKLLRWLDPAQHPILIQMPRATYRSVRARYDLPPIDS